METNIIVFSMKPLDIKNLVLIKKQKKPFKI